MQSLTAKQFKFKEGILKGLTGFDAAREADYKGNNNTLRAVASENLTKSNIIKAIAEGRAKLAKIVEHSYEKAVEMLTQRLAWLDEKAKDGNVQAIQAQTAIIRELNCITGLQKQTIKTEQAVPQPSEAERKALADISRKYKLKLA